jgi:galactokinase/mevalonate kinase-like predicted kinase
MPPSPGASAPFPYRLALAGGWIDQPFISRLNPEPPGSMVVVNIHPTHEFMTRAGMATGTRKVALRIWPQGIPDRPAADLVKELYAEENKHLSEPSGSQDMIGLLYPGINRLDYDFAHEGGIFPRHIESNNEAAIAAWLEKVIHLVPVAPRPEGYNPLGIKNLDPNCVRELGQTGKDCFDAIVRRDINALGQSMNRCMACWAALLPHVVAHPTITVDLMATLQQYQARYPGAMYSGCGGGYLYVVSDKPIPGALKIKIRRAKDKC